MSTMLIHSKKTLWQDRARQERALVDRLEFVPVRNDLLIAIPVDPDIRLAQSTVAATAGFSFKSPWIRFIR
jgi:hypothetical protein